MPITLVTQNSYPLNGTTTFPIGEELILEFDNLVDDKSIKESIALIKSINNSIVDCEIKSYAVDANGNKLDDNFLVSQVTQKTIVSIKPNMFLEANTNYELYVRGSNLEEVVSLNDEFASNTVSKRTVFNTSLNDTYTDQVRVYGSYEGSNEQELNIEVILAGEDSAAKYIWWFSDEAKPAPNGNRFNRTTSRWRSLARGCYIKFYGGSFVQGDTYKVKVYPKDKLIQSYRIAFSTAGEDLVLKPEVSSESPIGLVVPDFNIASDEPLKVISMHPKVGSINNDLNTNKVTITFNKNIDSSTVNQDAIKMFKQPVSGFFAGANKEQKIPKEIIVENNKIILEF